VAGVPGDPLVYYAGSASGGVAKTTDGGVHWQHVFDAQPVQSIGALAVAPSDPNIVWAGTGEAWIRSHISIGDGIYKSTDAGKTWTHMGLDKTGRIGRVVVDPANPQVVLACALGHAYGPQPERGVFRTTDGGATWQRTLFVDENTGCSELAMNPSNPRILFAGMWQLEIHTWGRESGGPGSGLFMSRDGGATWKKLTGHGLPAKPVGKVMPAIAQSNPNRVYAAIETGDGLPWKGQETERGQLFRSDDGGDSWKMVNADRNVLGRTAYYGRMAVSTDNENETYHLNASYSRSIDGGLTLVGQTGDQAPGGDHHDIWIDPTNGNRIAVAHDQGVSISQNRGRTWLRQRLANAQLYHVTVDNQVPYYLYTNKQDGPSYRGPSNSRVDEGGGRGGNNGRGAIPRGMWHSVGGGESGFATPDPVDPNVIWSTASGAGSVGGIVVRYDESRRQLRNVEVWPDNENGPAADLKYRFVWDAPFHISPNDHNRIYIGSQYLHQSTDGGQSWQEISPDLTLNDKSRQQSSGGLTPDNIGVEYANVIHAIAESPKQAGVIWVGTNDGLVQVTRDGGKTWTNVTKNIPNLPPWGTVGNIEPSRFDAGTAYVAIDFHQVNNRDPFVYKTTDFGGSWKAITNGVAHSMLSYAHCVREDPVKRGLLYLGTENGIYVSFDDGENWQPLQLNLPHAPVYWIVVQEHFNDLVIATYGRGAWILDDVTPLRDLTPQVLNADAHLFTPRPAYRFRAITEPATPYDDPTAGDNPPYGADIDYYLKAAATGPVTIAIQDAKGQTVRTLNGQPSSPGLHRVYWDLRDTPSKRVAFRTAPLYAPDVRIGADGLRESEGGFGVGGGGVAILQGPGTYTVKLTVGGRDYTQPLRLLKDPHSAGTEADIEAQQRMLLDVRRDLDAAVDAVNGAEMVRGQIAHLLTMIDNSELKRAAQELDQKIAAAEGALVELRATGRGQDGVRFGSKLVQKFGYLANGLQSGDFKPTNQQLAVQKDLEERQKTSQGQLTDVLNRELGAFNDMLRRANMPSIVTTPARRTSSQ
ncbi:MAG TPA: hypothetical protein VKD69_09245, partial [Vicinamibacterales bacterium]|nr:hypothetical protein [Vicinamibacterales bacterium]